MLDRLRRYYSGRHLGWRILVTNLTFGGLVVLGGLGYALATKNDHVITGVVVFEVVWGLAAGVLAAWAGRRDRRWGEDRP